MARPTEYNEEIITKAKEYIALCQDEEIERESKQGNTVYKLKAKLPTKGGLASYLDVNRDTLYDWSQKYPEFSDIMEEIGAEQEDRLINNGLSGDYNPTIAKVLLTKHGYRDAQEIDHTTKGEKIDNSGAIAELTKKLNDLHRGTSLSGDGESSSALGTQAQD